MIKFSSKLSDINKGRKDIRFRGGTSGTERGKVQGDKGGRRRAKEGGIGNFIKV